MSATSDNGQARLRTAKLMFQVYFLLERRMQVGEIHEALDRRVVRRTVNRAVRALLDLGLIEGNGKQGIGYLQVPDPELAQVLMGDETGEYAYEWVRIRPNGYRCPHCGEAFTNVGREIHEDMGCAEE